MSKTASWAYVYHCGIGAWTATATAEGHAWTVSHTAASHITAAAWAIRKAQEMGGVRIRVSVKEEVA